MSNHELHTALANPMALIAEDADVTILTSDCNNAVNVFDEQLAEAFAGIEDDARNNISEFITKITNFYKRQMTATVEYLSKKGVEKELQEQAVNDIQIQMDAALAAAQQSIVLGNKTWDKFKKSIDKYQTL